MKWVRRPPAVVSRDEVEAEKAVMRAVDTRPIKKIAEAKARKRRRLQVTICDPGQSPAGLKRKPNIPSPRPWGLKASGLCMNTSDVCQSLGSCIMRQLQGSRLICDMRSHADTAFKPAVPSAEAVHELPPRGIWHVLKVCVVL